jgi:hypothetical protein
MAVTSSIPVACLQARGCQQVIPRVRQVRIMPCMRSKPSVSPAGMLRTSFSEALIFSIHVACRKTLYGRQTSSLFLVRLSRLDCPREEILVVALSIVMRRCNSFQHEVFRVCTHPEANFVCRKTSLEIFRPLARTSSAARPR